MQFYQPARIVQAILNGVEPEKVNESKSQFSLGS
jgi:hypothetical protein